MSLRQILAAKRDEILRIAERHGATGVRLIGSVARGQETADSDLDLLVSWRPDTSLFDHAALQLELERLLERGVDVASDGWLRPEIKDHVYRDARPL